MNLFGSRNPKDIAAIIAVIVAALGIYFGFLWYLMPKAPLL